MMSLKKMPAANFATLSALIMVVFTWLQASASVNADGPSDVNTYNRRSTVLLPEIADPYVTLQVLEELAINLRAELGLVDNEKRNFDGGYGSRYVAAHNVVSKLMALKQAADWNGPGRKRRDLEKL